MRKTCLAPALLSVLVGFVGCASQVDSDGAVPPTSAAAVAAGPGENAPAAPRPLVEQEAVDSLPAPMPAPPNATDLSSTHKRIAADTNADSPLPPEWQEIGQLASTAIGMFTGFGSALSTATSVLQTLGFLHGAESEMDKDFHALDNKLTALENLDKAGFHDAWARDVGHEVGVATGSRSSAAQAVADGQVLRFGEGAELDTSEALKTIEQPSYWFRPFDQATFDADYMFRIVKDRPAGADTDGNGSVWDYRTTLPAFLQVVQARLDVLSMIDPAFVRNGHYASDLLALQAYLRGVRDHMITGIRCGGEYRMFPADGEPFDPVSGTSDVWRYNAGCVDIFSGAVSVRSLQWLDKDEPDFEQMKAWIASSGPNDEAKAAQDLRARMGIPALDQLIAKLGWYAQASHPLYTGFEAIAHTGSYDSVSVVTPVDSAAAYWSYDPVLKLLRNGEGRCLKTSSFVSAPPMASCDWNDASYQWIFDSPTRLRNVKTNQCLDTAQSGAPPTIYNVQPCDGRATENVTFLAPQGSSACRSAPTPASKRVRSDLAVPWDDAGQTSVAVFASGGNVFPGGTQWMNQQGGWGNTGRWATGDFDGDGFADLAGIWNDSGSNSIAVRSSNGSTLAFKPGATRVGGWSDATQWIPGDFDGDGYDDLVSAWNDGGRVSLAFFRSLGRSGGFAYPVAWATQDGGWGDDVRWVSGYFYGNDRRADLVAIWNDGGMNTLSVRQSTGSSFVYVPAASGTRWGGWMPTSQWVPGDFDGDGNTDVAVAWDDAGATSIAVFHGGAKGFTGYGQVVTRDGAWDDLAKWTSGDYDGDGKTDLASIVESEGQNMILVRSSTGPSFKDGPISPRQGGWLDSSAWCSGKLVH